MNNSFIIKDNILEAPENIDNSPLLRKEEQELLEVINAIDNIKQSNYWKVLEDKVFSWELSKLQRMLCKEKDPTVMFRLQGQITGVEKFTMDNLLTFKRNELLAIRNSWNDVSMEVRTVYTKLYKKKELDDYAFSLKTVDIKIENEE